MSYAHLCQTCDGRARHVEHPPPGGSSVTEFATGGVLPEGTEPLFLPSSGCGHIVCRDPEVRRNILREINEQDEP